MDINFARAIMTVLLLAVFIGIVLWAWSGKRMAAFETAARLPLEEDETDANGRAGVAQGAKT